MKQAYLIPVEEMLDVSKIEEYNKEFIKAYPNNWEPYVTKDNIDDYLKQMDEYKIGSDTYENNRI